MRSNNVVNLQAQLLTAISYLDLLAINPVTAPSILADLVGVNGTTKSRWNLTTGDACGTEGQVTTLSAATIPAPGAQVSSFLAPSNQASPMRVGAKATSAISLTTSSASATPATSPASSTASDSVPKRMGSARDHYKRVEEIQAYRSKLGIASKTGSFSVVFGPSTVSGNVPEAMTNTLSMGAPQNEYTAPSPIYIAILNAPGYQADNPHFVGMPLFPNSGSHICNGCYAYNLNVHTGFRLAQYYAVEPNAFAFDYATYDIEVRGAPSVPFTV